MAKTEDRRDQGQAEEIASLRRQLGALNLELQDLRVAHAKYRKAFHDNPVSMVITRLKDAIFIDANAACLEALGYSREEMIGKSAYELNVWVDFREREQVMNQISKTGCIRNYRYKYGRKSGAMVTALMSSCVIDVNGEKCLLTAAVHVAPDSSPEADVPLEAQLIHPEHLWDILIMSDMD